MNTEKKDHVGLTQLPVICFLFACFIYNSFQHFITTGRLHCYNIQLKFVTVTRNTNLQHTLPS